MPKPSNSILSQNDSGQGNAVSDVSEIACVNALDPEEVVGAEWWEWAQLTPEQRFARMEILWHDCLALGMSLDAEPDTQSPFYDPNEQRSVSADGKSGMRVLRRAPN